MLKLGFRKLAVLGMAATMAGLGVAAPASAAPSAPAGAPAEVSPTLVPAGSRPQVGGPTYYFGEGTGGREMSTQAVASLPFNYTFDVSYGIQGRRFTTNTGKVCTWLTVKITSGDPIRSTLSVQLWEDISTSSDKQIGSTVNWPYDGKTYQYCWSPVTNGRSYYFKFGFYDLGNGAYAHGDGTATSS